MVSCRLTGTCTIALRSLVKRGMAVALRLPGSPQAVPRLTVKSAATYSDQFLRPLSMVIVTRYE